MSQDPKDKEVESLSLFSSVKASPEANDHEPGYRALSLLALGGFLLAALYTLIILIMTLVGLLSNSPTLLSPLTLSFPVLAIIICLVARYRIRNSEGTLAGEKLASWGLVLCLFVGLAYWSYRSAVYYAIRQQASSFAENWIRLINQNELHRAALRMLAPLQRMRLKDNEKELEAHMNMLLGQSRDPNSLSPMDMLRQRDYVGHLQMDTGKINIELLAAESFEHTSKGYEITLRYRISSSYYSFEMLVSVIGTEAPRGEYAGRRWRALLDEHKTRVDKESIVVTAKGRAMEGVISTQNDVVLEWSQLINSQNFQRAYLLTIPPQKRAPVSEKLANRSRIFATGGCAALVALEKPLGIDSKTLLGPDYLDYLKATNVDVKQIKGSAADVEALRKLVQGYFKHEGTEHDTSIDVRLNTAPVWSQEDGHLVIQQKFRMMFDQVAGVEGILVMKMKLPKDNQKPDRDSWWIDRFIFTQGRLLTPLG